MELNARALVWCWIIIITAKNLLSGSPPTKALGDGDV